VRDLLDNLEAEVDWALPISPASGGQCPPYTDKRNRPAFWLIYWTIAVVSVIVISTTARLDLSELPHLMLFFLKFTL